MKIYDIVVIGGGSGGLNVAVGAATLGAKVALIEKNKLGGDCLYYGCVPSKALIKSAKVAHLSRNSKDYGIHSILRPVDLGKVTKHVQSTIKDIGKHDAPERFRKMGIDVIFGDPSFYTKNDLRVGAQRIRAKKYIISTGSHPFVPPIKGLDKVNYLTNMNIFNLKNLPRALAVIGGGPIGSEMAQAFARFGSKVTIFEGSNHVLSREDSDIANTLMKVFQDEGITINTNCNVKELQKKAGKVVVIAEHKKTGKIIKSEVNEVLAATGQRPAVKSLNLEKAGVELNERGGIKVNNRMQTTNKNIYACGDVIGGYQFTHIAEYQAKTIVWNLFFPFKKKVNYNIVPWTTYTDPELAHVGINEKEASEKGYKTYVMQGEEVDRFKTEQYDKGMAKLFVDDKGIIKGVTLLLPTAGELIHQFVLAMQANVKAQTISSMIHVYPTMADANKKIVNKFMAEKYLTPFAKRLAMFFFKFQ